MKDINFQIEGITCPACVKLCEKRISKIDGVHTVEIDLNGAAKICSEEEISLDNIREVLSDTDYKVR